MALPPQEKADNLIGAFQVEDGKSDTEETEEAKTNAVRPSRRQTLVNLARDASKKALEGPDVHGKVQVNADLPSHEEVQRAGTIHDYFNLIILPPILVLIAINMDPRTESWSVFWWHGRYFWTLLVGAYWYFIADLTWVIVVPHCVKSPATIIIHHLVTMSYMIIPVNIPEARWAMGALLSVELNTWFLIFRRTHNTAKLEPFKEGTPFATSIRIQFVTFMFYFTWIIIRVVFYPVMLPLIAQLYWERSQEVGYFNGFLPAPILQSVFVYLNLKWSYDLFFPKVTPTKEEGASRGL